jgi:hypothetical protein
MVTVAAGGMADELREENVRLNRDPALLRGAST